MTDNEFNLTELKTLLERGLSPKEARDYMAKEMRSHEEIEGYFKEIMETWYGRAILRDLSYPWLKCGLKPPFTEFVSLDEIFEDIMPTA